jgi:hypothetical protein
MNRWDQQLDVVNCTRHFEDICNENAYVCPTVGKNYLHRRSKYFGLYRNKHVELIAHIDAVVDVRDGSAEVLWQNVERGNDSLISDARSRLQILRPNELPKRIFLLSDPHLTEFEKDTPGGMRPSRQYFDISGLNASDFGDLARKLNGKAWSQV